MATTDRCAAGHEEEGQMAQTTSRAARLEAVLAGLLEQAPEVEAAAVVSFDGLPMAAMLPPGMDEDRVAAMSAALLSLGERATEGLGRGELSQVYIEGDDGTVFLISAEDEAVLVAVVARGAKAGMMLFEVRRAAGAVAAVLRRTPDPVVAEFEAIAGAAGSRTAEPPTAARPGAHAAPPGGSAGPSRPAAAGAATAAAAATGAANGAGPDRPPQQPGTGWGQATRDAHPDRDREPWT
jgi:predicted regulator of Ras-like GTPase activity (Roadblock/LC7/MglB family)